MPMTSDEIRETYLSFFQQRGHHLLRSAPLVPATHDPSVLLTTAGMHPLKPYFQGVEAPPARRLTSCQKCFRSTDIENVGNTLRHLTFFEMLGNFSIGDYFKAEVIRFAWELSTEGFGLDPDRIWVTVFGGDEELGLGPDEEAIELWLQVGVPRERIVECDREDNFWQAGPTGPCGPCSELYLDRGLEFGKPDDLPAGENERFLEFWNLVFMQFNQDPVNTLTPLPSKNIDTGLGLNRFAAMLQGKESVFETDQFWPLIELGQELSGRRYGQDEETTRALRILADHSRAMTFLVADGVVPSNEDRGYILRRVMRRAIQHGRRIGIEPGFLPRFADEVERLMGNAYPELLEQREAIRKWLAAEEESFGRTLEQGTRMLDELIAQAKGNGEEGLGAADVFQLHDTYGFPIEVTREIAAEHDLGVDESGFEALMEQQRTRARLGGKGGGAKDELRERAVELAGDAGFQSEFTGYVTTAQETTVGALEAERDGRVLVKLVESPFYAAGGGQVSDSGWVRCADGDCRAKVVDVLRVAGGADQVVVVEPEQGALKPGEQVHAIVDRAARHATEANHTATHLLHAALRRRLGGHVRQAGSAVQPDKLRFDFTHGHALSPKELRDVEDEVNEWILANYPVRALTTTLDEAKSLGAMALFGEKYGDVVRMVEVGDGSFSRELCGGTHVRSTAEIGLFRITAETSSAANVRRIEAITGPAAVTLLRAHDEALRDAATELRATPEQVPAEVGKLRKKVKQLEKAAKQGGGGNGAVDVDQLLASATEHGGGARVLTAIVETGDPKALPDVADRLKGKLGDAAIVLGTVAGGRVHLVATVAPALVERGVKAGAIVKVAAEVTGGGGGGRDTMARAGGRDPEKLAEAIDAARSAIEAALAG
ncbi:alanine--tRNA ligase [Conexibacter arvalis]|uniref:Alanine--tRNA ligase n=1 Tax=Conexibacter arvalis TaxID=912552 RepID=A0A840IKW4_9ACTN|nr:alanine--tRNA ligase [Conexibacter arvalis]MBB4664871.1 alanyl-tRNA synthetase [Conexibacter arvalis]